MRCYRYVEVGIRIEEITGREVEIKSRLILGSMFRNIDFISFFVCEFLNRVK